MSNEGFLTVVEINGKQGFLVGMVLQVLAHRKIVGQNSRIPLP